ncbi:MAG: DUF1080 domain-containing protein [Lentisphaeraceae bacterium]|nr:DUF1080 domain-containing protein [Lentisphaeraceae bacterium]
MKFPCSIICLSILLFLSSCATKFDSNNFKTLFNGEKDLSVNWIGNLKGHEVVDGAIVTKKKSGNLYTKEVYQDYIFKFDFKLPKGGNNGVGLRAINPDADDSGKSVAYSSVEVQILDDTHPAYANLKDWQFHGSAYGLTAAKKGHLKPVGEWNTQEIYLKGNHLMVRLNGTVILDTNLSEAESNPSPYNDKKLGAGRNRGAGHIAFCGHGEGIAFKNISVAKLEDDYTQIQSDSTPEGFTKLFDGETFNNWQGLLHKPNDKPHIRAKLNPEQLKAEQAKANESMKKHWHIQEGGVLYFDGEDGGHSLATVKKYGNFEFHCSWKIAPNSDSGIYLRGLPQVQIWDPNNKEAHKHGAQKGSGGLWNNPEGKGKWPLVKADKPAGEWNHFFIRMIEDKVTIWLNGQLIVNGQPLHNLWEKDKPIPEAEQIELQCHGDPVWFKNIYIKELP